MACPEGTTWVFDYPLMDDLTTAAADDFAAPPAGGFFWSAAPPMQPLAVQAPMQAVAAASAPNPW